MHLLIVIFGGILNLFYLEIGLILILNLQLSHKLLQQLIIILQPTMCLCQTFLIKFRLGGLGLKVNMMCMIVLPSFLPKTFNFPHLHFRIHVTLKLTSIELPYLLLQAISLDKAFTFFELLCVSQIFIMLSFHKIL